MKKLGGEKLCTKNQKVSELLYFLEQYRRLCWRHYAHTASSFFCYRHLMLHFSASIEVTFDLLLFSESNHSFCRKETSIRRLLYWPKYKVFPETDYPVLLFA